MADPKPRVTAASSSHPTSAEMVIEAITELNVRGGSSLYAIKKYIAEKYKVDMEKQGNFIKKALKKAVETGKLIQPKGTGATGSFKLAVKPKPPKKPASDKSPAAKKVIAGTSPAKKSPKNPVPPKAKPAAPASSSAKVPKATAKPKAAKSPTKAAAAKKITAPKVKPAAPAKPKAAKAPAKPEALSPKKPAPKVKKQ